MNGKILIVEDEEKLREVLCDYFRSKGDVPIEAENGVQALELLDENEFDAVLLDIMMPELDGLSVCRAVRRTNDVPIIFLTALSAEEEMLDLSRLEAGKVKLSRDDFSLVELTRSIFEKLDKTAQAKKLQIEFSFPDNFTITADEARIAQVVENFATNAIKYTSVGGHVGVRIQAGHSGVVFSIENECEPLSNEALSQIWDTFYRGDEARSGEGTGLGLAIAKNIVELHGGKCSVRNTKAGVEFRFTIKQ